MSLLSQYFLPNSKLVRQTVQMLSNDSQKLLTDMATELSTKVFNFKNKTTDDLPQLNDLVLVPDRLTQQKFSTLTDAIGRVTSVVNNKMFIQMLNHITIDRQNEHIISAHLKNSDNCLDFLDLPLYPFTNCQPLQEFYSQYEYNLPNISKTPNALLGHKDITHHTEEEEEVETPEFLSPNAEKVDTTSDCNRQKSKRIKRIKTIRLVM